MKILLLAVLLPSLAHAECDIYDAAGRYQGNMITTGTMYVGVFPGASDSTPYAGDFRDNVVHQGEKSPKLLAKVSGNQLFDLDGNLIAVAIGKKISDVTGTPIATVRNPYRDDGFCDSPGVALAGVALFVIYPQPNPGP